MIIREAALTDADAIAALSCELGYAATPAAAAERLARILGQPDQRACVAVVDGRVVGWAQAHATTILESGFRAEIVGLIVGDAARRRGVGRALVHELERWAAEIGATSLVVRSNVSRVESHRFYPALGYELTKTQSVYRKQLARRPGA